MLEKLATESRNPNTMNIDLMSIREILEVMNNEDQTVPLAVRNEIDHIEKAVKFAIASFENGGRLIYVGAGTSGRLGILMLLNAHRRSAWIREWSSVLLWE